MSRFSPGVLPTGPRSDLAQEFIQGFAQIEQNRRQRKADAEHTEDREALRTQRGREADLYEESKRDRSTARAVDAANRYRQGYRTREQLEMVSRPAPGGAVVRDLEGREVLTPHQRYERFGDLYVDPQATPEAVQQRQEEARRGRVSEALAQMNLSPGEQALFLEEEKLIAPRLGHNYNLAEISARGREDRTTDGTRHNYRISEIQEGGRQSRITRQTPTAGDGPDGKLPITLDQAIDQVRDLYSERDELTGDVTGYSISNAEIVKRAQGLVQGQGLPADAPRPAPAAPARGPGLWGKVRGFFGQFSYADAGHPSSTSGPRPARPVPPAAKAAAPKAAVPVAAGRGGNAELDALAAEFAGPDFRLVGDRDLRESLIQEGISEEDADYIVQARKRR